MLVLRLGGRQPQIVYVGISNFNRLMLCEYSVAEGRFHEIVAKMIASKTIPDSDTSVSYSAGECVPHCCAAQCYPGVGFRPTLSLSLSFVTVVWLFVRTGAGQA